MSDLQPSDVDDKIVASSAASKETEKNAEETAPAGESTNTLFAKSSSSTPSWIPDAGNWTCTWINTAKEKTKSTLEAMKKDISEFSDTLQQGANTLATATAKQAQVIQHLIAPDPDENSAAAADAKEQKSDGGNSTVSAANPEADHSKQATADSGGSDGAGLFGVGLNWMKQVVDTVQKYATEDTTNDEAAFTEEIRLGPGGRRTLLDQFTLLQMQNDTRTFLQAPQQNVDLYKEWLSDFKIVEYNGEINMLLGYNPRLREIYAELVPSQVDNNTFWNRYFFKVHLKELDKQLDAMGTASPLNVDKIASAPHSQQQAHSPAASNGGRDDWSMCSSGVTTEAEEIDSGGELGNSREEAPTPRPGEQQQKQGRQQSSKTTATVKNNTAVDEDADDWEECEEHGADDDEQLVMVQGVPAVKAEGK